MRGRTELVNNDTSMWSVIIADTIEKHLTASQLDKKCLSTFVDDLAEKDSALYDPANVLDRNLSAAWNFADSYFDAYSHRFADLDGISWSDAETMLSEIIVRLRSKLPIVDQRVLAYANS